MQKEQKIFLPLQEGTSKCILRHLFQWIHLHELHNINQHPRYLIMRGRGTKRHRNMSHSYNWGQQTTVSHRISNLT